MMPSISITMYMLQVKIKFRLNFLTRLILNLSPTPIVLIHK